MSRPPRSERDAFNLDALWAAFVPDLASGSPTSKRAQDACDMLIGLRDRFDRAVDAGDEQLALEIIQRGRAIFALLSNHVADWLVDFPAQDLRTEREDGKERASLLVQLQIADRSLPASSRDAVDPLPVMLPRWLFERLSQALEALGSGEVHPLVAPLSSGKHDQAWTWQRFRLRALQYVAFLNGQGVQLGIARRRVGTSIAVSPATLRDWSGDLTKAMRSDIELAAAAGRLKVDLAENVGATEPIDDAVGSLLRDLDSVSLPDFGKEYQDRFGRRHNQPSAGD